MITETTIDGTTVVIDETGPEFSPAPTAPRGLFIRPPIQTDQPAWFQERQFRAWETFESLPLPHRKDQAWRFATLGKLDIGEFTPAKPVSPAEAAALIARSKGNERVAGTMIFANDKVVHRAVLNPELE